MKKKVWLPLLTALVILIGTIGAVQASVTPSRGPGQIGLSSVVICEELSVRQQPNSDSKLVQKLKYGTKFIVLEQKSGWAKIIMGDGIDLEPLGWVNADYIAIDPAWLKTDDYTYVYAWNSTKAPKVGLLDKGTELPILKEEGDWYIVSLRGAAGWIHK